MVIEDPYERKSAASLNIDTRIRNTKLAALRRNLGVISLGIPLVKRLGDSGCVGWWPVARIRRALGSFPFLLLLLLPFVSFRFINLRIGSSKSRKHKHKQNLSLTAHY